AYPKYEFDHQERPFKPVRTDFEIPDLSLPQGTDDTRLSSRMDVLKRIDEQRAALDRGAGLAGLDRHRQAAASLLTNPAVRRPFATRRPPTRGVGRSRHNPFRWPTPLSA